MTGSLVNLVPAQYREVSVTEVPVVMEEGALRGYLTGRPVYRRTRYVVAQHGAARMVAEVHKESEQPLFSPVTAVTVLARAEETALVDAADIDTAVPTQLARAALEQAPGARCVIVRGRYGHVSFILDPAPIRVRVVEVVPPWPHPFPTGAGRGLSPRSGRSSKDLCRHRQAQPLPDLSHAGAPWHNHRSPVADHPVLQQAAFGQQRT